MFLSTLDHSRKKFTFVVNYQLHVLPNINYKIILWSRNWRNVDERKAMTEKYLIFCCWSKKKWKVKQHIVEQNRKLNGGVWIQAINWPLRVDRFFHKTIRIIIFLRNVKLKRRVIWFKLLKIPALLTESSRWLNSLFIDVDFILI